MTDYCPHDDDPLLCPPCQTACGLPQGTARPEPTGPPIPALYAGRCPHCREGIDEGDQIRRVLVDGDTEWWRGDCAAEIA